MPKIPVYEQGQLASSAVGTPGVDTSGTQLFGTIAQAAGGITDELARTIQANNVEAARKKREADELAKAQKKILDDIDVANHESKLDLQLGDEEGKVKAEKQSDPAGSGALFTQRGTDIMDKYLDGITDENVKNRVKLGTIKSINARANAMNGWTLTQRTANAQAGIESTLAEYVNRAGNLTTAQEVGQTWEKIEALRGPGTLAFGAKTDEIIRRAKTDVAEQYVNGLMIRDHNAVRPVLESGAFDSALNAEKRRQLIEKAGLLAKAEEQDMRIQDTIDSTNRQIETTDIVVNTDDNDLQSLIGTEQELTNRIEQIEALPSGRRPLSEYNHLVTQREGIRKKVENFGKDQNAERDRKLRERYESEPAQQSRINLINARVRIETGIKNKTFSKEQMASELEGYRQKLEKAKQFGYLDTPGSSQRWESEKRWLQTNIEVMKSKKESPAQMLQRGVTELIHGASQMFSGMPPSAGKTPRQSHDARNTSYQTRLNALNEKYRRTHNGADPPPDVLKLHDTWAKAGAQKDHP